MKPQLLVGFSVFDNDIYANAGAFVDVPTLSLEVRQVSNVDEHCNALSGSSVTNSEISKFLGNLTNIIPTAEIDLGLAEKVGAEIGKYGWKNQTGVTLLSTTTALPTACLMFDEQVGTFAPATVPASVTASATATATSTGADSSPKALGAAGTIRIPRLATLLSLVVFPALILLS